MVPILNCHFYNTIPTPKTQDIIAEEYVEGL